MRRIAGVVLGAVALLVGAPSAGAVTPEYFTFPAGYGVSNFGVTADGAGNIWFTAQAPSHNSSQSATQPTPALARLVPGQVAAGTANGISFFPLPDPVPLNCCANQVRSVSYNKADGRLWYVRDDGGLGFAKPEELVTPGSSSNITVTSLPGYVDLWDTAPSPAGGIWLTEHSASNVGPAYPGDRIAYYNGGPPVEGPNVAIQNGNTTLNSLRYDAKPSGITIGQDGRPWFVEEDPGNPGYRIASYSGTGSSYAEWSVTPCEGTTPCSGSYTGTGLTDVTTAPDGTLWFTNYDNRKLGRFEPGTQQMTQFTMASISPTLAAGKPRQITAAPDGTLWMTVVGGYGSSANAIVRIVPTATPTATVYPASATAYPLGIGADDAGNIWFGTAGDGSVAEVARLAGVVATGPVPAAPAPAGTTTTAPVAPAAAPALPTPAPGTTVLKPVSAGTAKITPPQTGNGEINTNQRCVGPPQNPCVVVYLIKEHEYVTAFPSSVGHAKKKKAKQPRVLGTKTVTTKGGQSAKVTVKLNRLGRRILKGKHKVKVVFTATQKLPGGKTRTLTRKTLTIRTR
jgi:hypothetical protein